MLAAQSDVSEKKVTRFQVSFWQSAQQLLNKRKTEAQLRRLRDENRLALHMCEQQGIYAFPEVSWNYLSQANAAQMTRRMESREMPLLSMSLLPAAKTRKSILPCIVENTQPGDYAYLVDVSPTATGARVVYASHTDIQASGEPMGRKYWGKHSEKPTFNKMLKALFDGYSSQDEWEQAVAGEQGAALSAAQLKIIGGLYNTKVVGISENVVPHNELLVAASHEHVRAICVPYFVRRQQDEAWYMPLEQLTGALAGLQHLDAGVELPVVLYQVNKPFAGARHSLKQGDFEYLGQGRSCLLEKAFTAIAAMQAHDSLEELALVRRYAIADALKFEAFTLLGIDVTKPRMRHSPSEILGIV